MKRKKNSIKKLNDNLFQKKLRKINPLNSKPYARPSQAISYIKACGLYDGFEPIRSAIIVYTNDWSTYLGQFFGPPLQKYFEFEIYQVNGFRFLMMNVTPGGQNACHQLEKLTALGVKDFIALGHSGSLTPNLKICDLVLHERAIRGENTSNMYQKPSLYSYPSRELTQSLEKTCLAFPNKENFPKNFAIGTTYTTESMFREPASRLEICRKAGILTVETEAASIFSLGSSLGVEIASLSVISNLLWAKTWRPVFYSQKMSYAKAAMLYIAINALGRKVN